eukprot:9874-Rhodomonas_salina.3
MRRTDKLLPLPGDFEEGTMHGQGRLKVNGSGTKSCRTARCPVLIWCGLVPVIDGTFHEGEMLEGEHRIENGPTYTGKLKEGTWTGRCKIVYPGGSISPSSSACAL